MRGIFEVHGLQAREQLLLFAVRERAASGVTALLVAALRACGGIASLEAALAELDGLHRELDRGARRALRLLAPTNARLDADDLDIWILLF